MTDNNDSKKLIPTPITFEKIDQSDYTMDEIFNDIAGLPDKDFLTDIPKNQKIKKKKHSKKSNANKKPDKEIDLHGKTIDESILMVKNFITKCFEKKLRSGLIITGKGHNSGEKGPVLNGEVKIWLEQNAKNYLIDFYDAPRNLGGSGAIWLNFKKLSN